MNRTALASLSLVLAVSTLAVGATKTPTPMTPGARSSSPRCARTGSRSSPGRSHEIELGDWFVTYHLRNGCDERSFSLSAPIHRLSKMRNIHDRQTRYLVTIDDSVVKERRTLRLRSITPLALRDR